MLTEDSPRSFGNRNVSQELESTGGLLKWLVVHCLEAKVGTRKGLSPALASWMVSCVLQCGDLCCRETGAQRSMTHSHLLDIIFRFSLNFSLPHQTPLILGWSATLFPANSQQLYSGWRSGGTGSYFKRRGEIETRKAL